MRLNKCPCGKVPDNLVIKTGGIPRVKYVYGDCCEKWPVRLVHYFDLSDTGKYVETAAVKSWNDAPRGFI